MIFAIGLFKKVIIADTIRDTVGLIFEKAAHPVAPIGARRLMPHLALEFARHDRLCPSRAGIGNVESPPGYSR